MEKKICAFIFSLAFVAISVVHGQSGVSRGPSVEQVVEVDIEEAKTQDSAGGYDFAARAPVERKRVPANIVTKSQETTPSSMVGPLIFFIALPIGLWIMVAKKFSKKSEEKAVDYYPKTQQFTPFKTDYQKTSDDDDDIDYPKAS